jgi:hypothetical protein
MPSVMATITLMPASAASRMASAAYGGGTKIIEASAPVSRTASCTVLNTGRPMCELPPLPGVTPPTSLVPYSSACSEWKVPCWPVKPWVMTLVFLLTKTLMDRSSKCLLFV